MAYAVVKDVPASWQHYEPLAIALRTKRPRGLIVHVAGPTDEGFRTIEVWQSREAWERFQAHVEAIAHPEPASWAAPTLRELAAVSTISPGADACAGDLDPTGYGLSSARAEPHAQTEGASR